MADNIIIFGGYALSFEEFKIIFTQWYFERQQSFLQELQSKIIIPLENMIKIDTRINSKGVITPVTRKIKGKYDAKKIYLAWEKITQDYFGNGAVSLIAAAKFGNESYNWTNILNESSVLNKSGINIRKTGLNLLQEQTENIDQVFAAQDVQDFLNTHYNDLLKTLGNYTLSKKEAHAMHILLGTRKSILNKQDFHFTGATYDKIIFSTQGNAEGKKLDAFMNHIGKYNSQLFSVMSVKRVSANSLLNITLNNHGGFSSIFSNSNEVQPWLLDSLNSASWLSGGDIIVVDKNGAVIYNIQLKTTGKGKVFDLATSKLLTFSQQMVSLIQENKPEQLAELMFQQLKTQTANDFQRTENFFESKAYEMVQKNLGLTNINIELL